MSGWLRALPVALGLMVASWALLVLLARRLPPGLLRDLAGFVPDCVTTVRRLRGDPRVPRRAKRSFRSFGESLTGSPAMTSLVDDLVPAELWAIVEPLLPVPPRPPYGGRRRAVPDRNCFAAIVFMARTSTPWRLLPARELGCGSPATCWRRLTEWAKAGVFDQLHLEILDRLGQQGVLDWTRACVDTMSVRAKRGGITWAQIQSIGASLEASSTWSATVAVCR